MMRTRTLGAAALSVTVGGIAWLVPAGRAEACSQPLCVPAAFTPKDGGTVPAEGAVFFWRPGHSGTVDTEPEPSQVSLFPTGDPDATIGLEATEVEGGFALSPTESLVEGNDYTLSSPSGCGDDSAAEVEFRADAPAPRPEELGTGEGVMTGVGELRVASYGGACSAQVEADRARVELIPADEVRPWFDLLHFETFVDGEPWTPRASATEILPPGESWRGRGRDEVFTTCAADDDSAATDVAAGDHEVLLRATLPGTDLELETSAFIWLDKCGEAGGDDGGGDAGVGGGSGGGAAAGCAANGAGGGPLAGLALAALALFARGARRRGAARPA